MATSFKLPHSAPPTLYQVTTDSRLCRRLLDTHEQVWVSLLQGHCFFLLGPGAHLVLFVPSKSLFPQSCVSSGGSMMGLMATSSKRPYHTQVSCTQNPCPCSRPLLTRTSTRDIQTQFWLSLCGVSGSWCAQGFVCALQESVSPVLWKFWWLYGGVNGNFSKRAYAIPRSAAPEPLPLRQAAADPYVHRRHSNTQRQVCSVSVESPGAHKVLFEPSEYLWCVWGLILNAILPLLSSC